MSPRLLLHTDQRFDTAARIALTHELQAALGSGTRLEPSRRPHLLFASHDAQKTTSRQLLAAIRRRGIKARFVDL